MFVCLFVCVCVLVQLRTQFSKVHQCRKMILIIIELKLSPIHTMLPVNRVLLFIWDINLGHIQTSLLISTSQRIFLHCQHFVHKYVGRILYLCRDRNVFLTPELTTILKVHNTMYDYKEVLKVESKISKMHSNRCY